MNSQIFLPPSNAGRPHAQTNPTYPLTHVIANLVSDQPCSLSIQQVMDRLNQSVSIDSGHIRNIHKQITNLSIRQFKNVEKSSITEVISNALDAHIRKGTREPIHINLRN